MNNEDGDEWQYRAVVNGEEQYSIWPVHAELPAGWHSEGATGTADDCLAHISAIWTDVRPRSLRVRMAAESTAAN